MFYITPLVGLREKGFIMDSLQYELVGKIPVSINKSGGSRNELSEKYNQQNRGILCRVV